MGRFPNIAAAKAKTGAARGKLYGMYAKEIYQTAKNGGVTPEGNPAPPSQGREAPQAAWPPKEDSFRRLQEPPLPEQAFLPG